MRELEMMNKQKQEKSIATKPTHEQAQLHLQVYHMRREARLREARDWFFKNYIVETIDDSMRIAPPGSESGALVMMVLSYWDQACAVLDYGLLHEDLFFETSGEFFAVWERVKPIVAKVREVMVNKQYLGHLEQAAQRYESWSESRNPGHIAGMRKLMKQMSQQNAAQAQAR
jgi:hypothetical protein